ncbi:hypothetical protein MTO96_049920 [Rhipicephalus appendiculatus]
MIFAKGSLWKRSRDCMAQFFTSAKLRAVMPSLLHAQQQFIDILGRARRQWKNLYHWPRLLSVPSKLLGAIYANPLAEMTKKAAEIIMYRRKNPQVCVFQDAFMHVIRVLG